MFEIYVPPKEFYRDTGDESTSGIVSFKGGLLEIEHSLLSVSKWEAKHEKPYMTDLKVFQKTPMEIMDYFKIATQNDPDPLIYDSLTSENIQEISEYIKSKQTATWFRKREEKKPGKEIITTEIVYYWMFSLGIPIEMERIHLNRLLTLISVCSEKQREAYEKASGKRRTPRTSKTAILAQQRELNAKRRAQFDTPG